MMKMTKRRAGFCTIAAALALGSMSASANTLTFQGVTWTTTVVDIDTMTIQIDNALSSGSGNWANIAWLWALQVDPALGTVTGATITPSANATFIAAELNAQACSGGGSGKACFQWSPVLALTNSMQFEITFSGTGIDLLTNDLFHVKVAFLCEADGSPVGDTPPTIITTPGPTRTNACGSVMSEDIFTPGDDDDDTDLPEPGTLGLLGLGLLGVGLSRRRKA